MEKQEALIDPPGFNFTLKAEWAGAEEYLHNCKVEVESTGEKHIFDGASIPGQDLSTQAYHVTEDGSEATHLFTCKSGVEDGDVVTEVVEVLENPFLTRQDLEESGLDDDWPGEGNVKAVSEGKDGLFVWMRSTNADSGTSEYHLRHFEAKAFRGGDRMKEFEIGRPL